MICNRVWSTLIFSRYFGDVIEEQLFWHRPIQHTTVTGMTVVLVAGWCMGNFCIILRGENDCYAETFVAGIIRMIVAWLKVWKNISCSSCCLLCFCESARRQCQMYNIKPPAVDLIKAVLCFNGEIRLVVCELLGVKKAQRFEFRCITESVCNVRSHYIDHFHKLLAADWLFVFTVHPFHPVPFD